MRLHCHIRMSANGLPDIPRPHSDEQLFNVVHSPSRQTPSGVMATNILRRTAARSSITRPFLAQNSTCRRWISTSPTVSQVEATTSASAERRRTAPTASDSAQTTGAKNVFEFHTVEDLQGMSAVDLLSETGTRGSSQMRHFTGRNFLLDIARMH